MLTRTTAILAGLFFVTSLVLSILAGMNRKPASILQGNPLGPSAPAPGAPPPLAPGGLLNQLQGDPPAGGAAAPARAGRALGAGGAAVEMTSAEGAGEPAPSR